MKIKCKKCERKFKLRSPNDVDCDKSDCDVKYDMHDDILDFDGFEGVCLAEMEIISDFESETPAPTTSMTEKEHQEWIESCGLNSTNQHSVI